ncbi:hypothetical protein N8T08_001104 [Aspergillus melleus]|uniref:Uncharacterized protein n=1 Tax=Aspergillus melleus TaxID=138277 RepID=A0ACC3AP02_9EURO|nr:hypothetical protein N8T08_001104 [Aspergillus melleus]
MAGSTMRLNPEAPLFVYRDLDEQKGSSQQKSPTDSEVLQDERSGDEVEARSEANPHLANANATEDQDPVEDFWTADASGALVDTKDAPENREDNNDQTQDNMIALARTKSPEWNHFHGPRERWIRFEMSDEPSSSSEPKFLPAKSKFTHGDTAVCLRISDRPVAGKLAFQAFVTRAKSPVKKELHPENVAHSARLEFDLHPFVDRRFQRCVQNFCYTEHLPTKANEGDETDSGNEVEYIAPCYIDIEFETTGGVSQGLLDGHEFNSETTELFAYMYSLTRAASTKLRTVKFRVDVDPHDVPRLTGFLEALDDVSNSLPTSAAWYPYRAHGGELRILFGQQKPRLIVHQAWGSEMVKFRAQAHFYDIDTYLVKMAYGAVQEWRRPYEMIKRIQLIPALIKLKSIGGSIVAIAMLERSAFKEDLLPPELKGMDVVLPQFTEVQVIVRVHKGSGPATEWTASGFTVPEYIENEAPGAIQIVLHGARLGKLLNTNEDNASVQLPGTLKFEINKAPIKRSINALAKLKANEYEVARWFPLLLNHEPNALPDVDLLRETDPKVVESALRHLLKLKQWNAEQTNAFRSLRKTKAGCSLLEGFPGCGKTTVMAAITIFFYLCGFNILLVGPSNAAVDVLNREFKELRPDLDYVRVRRGEVEKRSKATANPRETDDGNEGQAEIERHTALIGLLTTLKETRSRRVQGDLEQSVLSWVLHKCDSALASGEEFILNVAKDTPKQQTATLDGAEPDSPVDLQDAYRVVHEYVSQPKVPRPKDASEEDLEQWYKRNCIQEISLLEWLKSKANDVEFRNGLELVGLDVSDGETEINQTTFSRSNKRNIEVVMNLIEHLISNNALNGLSCCILPTYADQKKAYVEAMIALSQKLGIAWEDMVSVSTVDSMQGNQADIVIVDWVITSGE